MTLVALITRNPFTIVNDPTSELPEVFTLVPNPLRLPDGKSVGGLDSSKIPWISQDGNFSVVNVVPFVPPNGQSITGNPSYNIDGSGNVTQTFATVATPPPPITSVIINSTGTPSINATYGLDLLTREFITEVLTYTQETPHKFPDGLSSLPVTDINGVQHLFPNLTLFTNFSNAYFDFINALNAGQTPTQPVTIA